MDISWLDQDIFRLRQIVARDLCEDFFRSLKFPLERKAEAVVDIIKGKVSLVDFCRANDLKQTDVEKWMDDFVKSGTQGLKSNAKDRLSEQDKQIAELQQVIGEQASKASGRRQNHSLDHESRT